jgi:hypothetical protein
VRDDADVCRCHGDGQQQQWSAELLSPGFALSLQTERNVQHDDGTQCKSLVCCDQRHVSVSLAKKNRGPFQSRGSIMPAIG